MNLYNVDIVKNEWDSFWNDAIDMKKINNEARVLIISATFDTGSAEAAQLEKMMSACKLDNTGYNIIQVPGTEKMAWHKLKSIFAPQYVILLGIMPAQLGISASFRLFGPNRFDDAIFIPSLSLTEMEQKPEAKKQLWAEGLKPMFVDSMQ
ncbi:MAG: hypothetical protein JST70_12520 [Bacteroidetes bacterium]|nr:hypothetical protein [Bacteroidota bacterium]